MTSPLLRRGALLLAVVRLAAWITRGPGRFFVLLNTARSSSSLYVKIFTLASGEATHPHLSMRARLINMSGFLFYWLTMRGKEMQMRGRSIYVGAFFFILIAVTACAAETQQPPSPTPVPNTPTPIPPTATSQPPTSTPAPPTPEPTTAPIPITTFEDMAGTWLRSYGGFDYTFRINSDGTGAGGWSSSPTSFWLEEGILHISNIGSSMCTNDQVGTYEVSGAPGEYIVFKTVDEPCAARRPIVSGKWTEASVR